MNLTCEDRQAHIAFLNDEFPIAMSAKEYNEQCEALQRQTRLFERTFDDRVWRIYRQAAIGLEKLF